MHCIDIPLCTDSASTLVKTNLVLTPKRSISHNPPRRKISAFDDTWSRPFSKEAEDVNDSKENPDVLEDIFQFSNPDTGEAKAWNDHFDLAI